MKNVITGLVMVVTLFTSMLVFSTPFDPIYYPKIPHPGITYDTPGTAFPDETSVADLPEMIPCIRLPVFGIRCNWMMGPRRVWLPSSVPGEEVSVFNEEAVICRGGKCRNTYGDAGSFSHDIDATVNIWYNLQESTDGKLIAVRRDIQDNRSYAYAGVSLFQWYTTMGPSTDQAKAMLENMYSGGWEKLLSDWEAMCDDADHDYSYCGD